MKGFRIKDFKTRGNENGISRHESREGQFRMSSTSLSRGPHIVSATSNLNNKFCNILLNTIMELPKLQNSQKIAEKTEEKVGATNANENVPRNFRNRKPLAEEMLQKEARLFKSEKILS